MTPDDSLGINTLYFAYVPNEALGLRLVVRRQALVSGGASSRSIDRIDAMLRQLAERVYMTSELLWAAELLWNGGDEEDRTVVTATVRLVYPVQVLNICQQIDRFNRTGLYPFDSAVAEAGLLLELFREPADEVALALNRPQTYDRIEGIARYVEEVIPTSRGVVDPRKVQSTADALRFSVRVLRSL